MALKEKGMGKGLGALLGDDFSADFSAPSHGKPICAYDRASRGCEAYAALAEEFLRKNNH